MHPLQKMKRIPKTKDGIWDSKKHAIYSSLNRHFLCYFETQRLKYPAADFSEICEQYIVQNQFATEGRYDSVDDELHGIRPVAKPTTPSLPAAGDGSVPAAAVGGFGVTASTWHFPPPSKKQYEPLNPMEQLRQSEEKLKRQREELASLTAVRSAKRLKKMVAKAQGAAQRQAIGTVLDADEEDMEICIPHLALHPRLCLLHRQPCIYGLQLTEVSQHAGSFDFYWRSHGRAEPI